MIRINPQWSKLAASCTTPARELLKHCKLLLDMPFEKPHKIHYYWNETGDLCIETWESDTHRIHDYIRDNIITRGLCGEDGKYISKQRR